MSSSSEEEEPTEPTSVSSGLPPRGNEITKEQKDRRSKKTAQNIISKADATKTSVNAWAAVGGASVQLRLNQQILAASDPKEYGRQRDQALERVQRQVNKY